MALPPAVKTATVTFGPFLDDRGQALTGNVTFTSSRAKVWTATGTPLLPRPIVIPLDVNAMGSVTLPATDQPGFSDGAGNAVTDWTYSADVALDGTTTPGAPRVFELPTAGATGVTVDLDLMTPVTSSVGVVVALPEVLSVNGQTGAVVIDTGGVDETAVNTLIGDYLVDHPLDLDDVANTATRVAMTPAQSTKLAGIATAATANATDAALRDRSTHTGEQAQSTVTGLTNDLAAKAPRNEAMGTRTKTGGVWPARPDFAVVVSIGPDPSPLDQQANDLRWIPT